MARRIFDFDTPDRFITGTVGEPGSRTFFLQVRRGSAVVSVVLEKVQVQALAERLGFLLAELSKRGVRVPEALAPHDDDTSPLDEPLIEAFRVGTMTLGWDASREQIVVEARAQSEDEEDEDEDEEDEETGVVVIDEDDDDDDDDDDDGDEDEDEDETFADDDPDGPDLVRVHLTTVRARAFVERSMRVVAAGRPPCPLCGRPLDPGGHICPRRNGYVH